MDGDQGKSLSGAIQHDLALEKIGYQTPIEAREQHELRQAA